MSAAGKPMDSSRLNHGEMSLDSMFGHSQIRTHSLLEQHSASFYSRPNPPSMSLPRIRSHTCYRFSLSGVVPSFSSSLFTLCHSSHTVEYGRLESSPQHYMCSFLYNTRIYNTHITQEKLYPSYFPPPGALALR